jgi:hypothetical protein
MIIVSTRAAHPHGAWLVTDANGRLEGLTPTAAALLGVHPNSSGRSLLLFFPQHRRALAIDMEVALTGWPTARTVVLTPMAKRPVAIRYLVSRHFMRSGVELHWTINVIPGSAAAN